MDFTLVRAVLSQHLRPSAIRDAWLDGVESNGVEYRRGQHLAVSLAIDLATGAVPPEYVEEIIKSYDPSQADAVKHFAATVEHKSAGKKFRELDHLPCRPPTNFAGYVRVLELHSFGKRYLRDRVGADWSDIQDLVTVYFPDHFLEDEKGTPMGYLENWSGFNDVVWVASYSSVFQLVGRNKEKAANTVCDSLGLPYQPENDYRPFLVAARYPKEIDLCCRKPTAFVANWPSADNFYLSAETLPQWPGWGKTQSRTGNSDGQHECIHGPIERLSGEFGGSHLGFVDKIEENFEKLLGEGEARLRKCLATS